MKIKVKTVKKSTGKRSVKKSVAKKSVNKTIGAKKRTKAEHTPTRSEVENGRKVLAILENIEDIGYIVHRPDLFSVEEPEFGLQITVDAEETVICLMAEICEVTHLEENLPEWATVLLQLNNKLLHGAFSLEGEKILLRENLASENLDANELEDALGAMFAGIIRYARVLKLS